MKEGSLVETVGDFEEVRRIWGLPYPKKGDVLTVSGVTQHPNPQTRKKGIVLLYFEELPGMIGIADKTIFGDPNFTELKLPDDLFEEIEEIIPGNRA